MNSQGRAAERQHGIYFDVSELTNLPIQLRHVAPKVLTQMKKELRVAGEMVAARARMRIISEPSLGEKPWDKQTHRRSTESARVKVAESVRVTVSGVVVKIVADSKGIPVAGLWELGNKGKRGHHRKPDRSTFRHPLYGHGPWKAALMHPFLYPALMDVDEQAENKLQEALLIGLTEIERLGGHV